MLPLVLASSSPFRSTLLKKLNLSFSCRSPEVDETPLKNELAHKLVTRLAAAKARAVVVPGTDELIIGSDQVAVFADQIIGKPLTHARAQAQLRRFSGNSVTFLTGLCLLNTRSGTTHTLVEPFEVKFRRLSDAQIERYLTLDQPYQCAGSFKCEGYGITLFEQLKGDDPNSLVGLPLIRLVELLQRESINLP
ncbi:Maf family protein [Motiliproteus sediminis]|uniref:Maf family protein n=1 Tax=Motiliproteus sediminis TaxID=1468178 RepID=UPI001AEFB603|nr:Maf family protein [Motiliproteus sediminis]